MIFRANIYTFWTKSSPRPRGEEQEEEKDDGEMPENQAWRVNSRARPTKATPKPTATPQGPKPVEKKTTSSKRNRRRDSKSEAFTPSIAETSKALGTKDASPKDDIVKLEPKDSDDDVEVINTPEVSEREDTESAWDELAEAIWQFSRDEL